MLDQLRQIAIFAKTIDHGSFRGAAKALRLSPSVVSHHITQLEEKLGVALLYRSTRKISVTPDGERLLKAAREMISAAEEGLQEVIDQSPQPSGLLRVTVPAVLIQSHLVDQIAGFSRQFPNVHLSLDFSDMRRELIADGFDVAIRMGWLDDSALKARKLFDVERRLVASTSYVDTKAPPQSPKELYDWDWIELAPVQHRKTTFYKGEEQITLHNTDARVVVNDASALHRMAQQGAGLAVIPDFLAENDIATGTLKHVLPDWKTDSIGVFAIWPHNAPKGGIVERFVRFLKKQ